MSQWHRQHPHAQDYKQAQGNVGILGRKTHLSSTVDKISMMRERIHEMNVPQSDVTATLGGT